MAVAPRAEVFTKCRGYSKVRTHSALGPHGRSLPRSIGPSYGRCVFLISSNPCIQIALHHTPEFKQISPIIQVGIAYRRHIAGFLRIQGYLAHTKQPPPKDHRRTLGKVLLQGSRRGVVLISEVPLKGKEFSGAQSPIEARCVEPAVYRGYLELRTHTVLGPFGRSNRTFLRAVCVLSFE